MNVVELFSGIGAQAKALEKLGIEHKILATCDWDINAIIAYDLIHNGEQNNNKYDDLSNLELYELLKKYSLSSDGKRPMNIKSLKRLNKEIKKQLLNAIDRTNNLIDVSKIRGDSLPNDQDIDLMTYSFPCQDLSLAGNWHHNSGGIDRDAKNRSSLLWEVERILFERKDKGLSMPRSLLMENVTSILSANHIKNFEEWKKSLNDIGYINLVMTLNAMDFGVPQKRKRTYMLSIYVGNDHDYRKYVNQMFKKYNENTLHKYFKYDSFNMQDVIKDDYNHPIYKKEAEESNPNFTKSRINIFNKSDHITKETPVVATVTTKQDRYPNSGLIEYHSAVEGKAPFRYLTPRECFILMGFDEGDYQVLLDNNIRSTKKSYLFTRDKMIKMAGNSICVNVLEAIFCLDILILFGKKNG